jgi:2-polyprenyl-6-methoxyphenol hydroxylase-like FAD-dependent oxidoreductase
MSEFRSLLCRSLNITEPLLTYSRMLDVRRPMYQRFLYEAAVREGVKVRFGCRVESISDPSLSITLSSGEKIEADLIVGADGESIPFSSFNQIKMLRFPHRYQVNRAPRRSWLSGCPAPTKQHRLSMYHVGLPHELQLTHSSPSCPRYPKLVGPQFTLDLWAYEWWKDLQCLFLHPPNQG